MPYEIADILFLLGSPKNYANNIRKHKLSSDIVFHTSFLPDDSSNSQRIWHLLNGPTIPKCPVCSNKAVFKRDKYTACSKECSISLMINGAKNSIDKARTNFKKACIEKYGVEHPMLDQKVAQDVNSKLIKDGKHYLTTEEFKKKAKVKINERYGVDSYSQTSESKERLKNTFLGTFGVINNFLRPDVIEQKKSNLFKKYKEWLSDYDLLSYDSKHFIKMKHKACEKEFECTYDLIRHRVKDNGGELCTHCNPLNKGYSIAEKELVEFIKLIYEGLVEENNKEVLGGLELDVYLPELNLAFEYNGLYSHSTLFKNFDYHIIKTRLCSEKDIRLIHVWEDSWLYKKDIVKSIISGVFRKNTPLHARKLELRTIPVDIGKEFFDQNHLQGYTPYTVAYGLYHEEELQQMISFVYFKNDDKWELSRLVTKLGMSVVGGASKILKHMIKINSPAQMVTYNDKSVFDGGIYKKLGFEFSHSTKPAYWYFNPGIKQRIHRRTMQKSKLISMGGVGENEYEMAFSLKYLRFYDCGNDVYKLELSNDKNIK